MVFSVPCNELLRIISTRWQFWQLQVGRAHLVGLALADAGVSRFHLTRHSRAAPTLRADIKSVWYRCDVTADGAPEEVVDAALDTAAVADARLTVVYCCGAWRAGRYRLLTPDQLRDAWAVGIDAPHRIACQLSRRPEWVSTFTLVSGLAGSVNHVAGNSIYAMVCDSARALVATLDAEARQVAGCFAAHGVQIGLVDKGQDWIGAFMAVSGQRPASDFSEAAKLIVQVATGALPGTRGSSIALAGEVVSYAELLALLAGGDVAKNMGVAREPT
jgi:hypothetical protein